MLSWYIKLAISPEQQVRANEAHSRNRFLRVLKMDGTGDLSTGFGCYASNQVVLFTSLGVFN